MFFIKILFFVSLSWIYAWANEATKATKTNPPADSTDNPSLVFSEKEGLTAVSLENQESDQQKSQAQKASPAVSGQKPSKSPSDSSNTQQPNTASDNKQTQEQASETLKKEEPLEVSTTPEEPESASTDSISESFAPTKASKSYDFGFLGPLLKDTSWFFQKKKTKHKLAFVPSYAYNGTQNSLLGLRLFSFSPKQEGYYLAFSGAKYIFKPYYSLLLTYKSDRSSVIRTETKAIYDNHPESYYGLLTKYQGMQAPLEEKTELHAHRVKINYDLFYQEKKNKHYLGLGLSFFSRTERTHLQDNKSHFSSEHFLFARAFAGWDSRDNWKYPTKGAFHQLSLGCKASLVFSDAYCQTQGDFRLYVSFLKNMTSLPLLQKTILSLRAFYGTSLFNPASYAVKYSLGESSFFQNLTSLRGFKSNRFIGDKMYFAQSELKVPLWKEYLIAALFLELGEVAQFKEAWTNFVYNYGAGLRIGWPNDTGMKLRVDYGLGKDQQDQRNYDVTISFLQAF